MGYPPDRRSLQRLITLASHGVNDIYFFLLPVVLPVIIRDLGLRLGSAGLLVSAFLLVVSVSSFFSGRRADRVAGWKLIAGGFLVTACGIIAAAFTQGYALLTAAFMLAGLGVGTFHPTAYAQFDRLALSRTGRSFAQFELWASSSLVVMFVASGALLRSIGWRGVLIVTGVLALLMVAVNTWGYRKEAGPADTPVALPPGHPATAASSGAGAIRSGVVHSRAVLLAVFLLATTMRFLCVTAVLNFLPTYLALERGFSPQLAAYSSAFIWVGGVVFCMLVGLAIDRFGPLPVLLTLTALIAPMVAVVSLPMPVWLTIPLIVVLGGVVTGPAPAQNVLLPILAAYSDLGAAFGSLMGISALVASLGPLVLGFLAEKMSIAGSLRLFTLPAFVSLALLVWLSVITREVRPPASRL